MGDKRRGRQRGKRGCTRSRGWSKRGWRGERGRREIGEGVVIEEKVEGRGGGGGGVALGEKGGNEDGLQGAALAHGGRLVRVEGDHGL